jgi:hypothetical protein
MINLGLVDACISWMAHGNKGVLIPTLVKGDVSEKIS